MKPFNISQLIVNYNSVGVNSTLLKTNQIYTVQVNVTDGDYNGYCRIYYRTTPSYSNEFHVEPRNGTALSTVFLLSVGS